MGPIPFIPITNYPPRHENDSENDNTWNSDDSRDNGNKKYRSSYLLFTPTLEDLKNVLYVALSPYFEEFDIAVVSCPCLTRAPYNLAAAGLSGNTGILESGRFIYFSPIPQTDVVFDIQYLLSRCSNDAFVIGSGFATQPSMPSNGHLTMNAVVSANHRNVINNSCIAYKVADRHEGKQGPVIKIRAKGRRSRSNIIALIQTALKNRSQSKPFIGLGIVLVINGGKTAQFILPHDFINYDFNQGEHCHYRFRPYAVKCENLIALGALISQSLSIVKYRQTVGLESFCSMFNIFCNSISGANFVNDITPEETEYIVYINIAQEGCYTDLMQNNVI